jgi:hypothetical protein
MTTSVNSQLMMLSNNNNGFGSLIEKYIDGEMPIRKFKLSECVNYKEQVQINGNIINITDSCDIIYGLELICESWNILNNIDNIELNISGNSITNIYPNECEIIKCDNHILINFDKIFLNYHFLPICSLFFSQIKIILNGINNSNFIKCYLTKGLLNNEVREELINNNHNILFNQYKKYNFNTFGNIIKIKFEHNQSMSNCNFIKYLRFKFQYPINVNSIKIYTDDYLYTTILKNDLLLLSKTEFIINNFYYKTFSFNNIKLEFDTNLNGNNLTLITSNYNLLMISDGLAGYKYEGILNREIYCEDNNLITLPSNTLEQNIVLSHNEPYSLSVDNLLILDESNNSYHYNQVPVFVDDL